MIIARRYWFAIPSDITRPIGGVKQIHRLAEAISHSGREAILIQENANFHPGWFSSCVNTISLSNWLQLTDLTPCYDVLVLPETFALSITRFTNTLPVVIFNQNGSYTFGLDESSMPNPRKLIDLYISQQILHVLCVSHHDFRFFINGFGMDDSKVSLIVNGVEESIFQPSPFKKRQITFMPRKNPRDVQIVCSILKRQSWFRNWSLKPISGCALSEVASILQESLLFFSFGHPEGFGLPVAEALACGCGVVGYSGLGGRELFATAKSFEVGKEIAIGDWLGFVDSAHQFSKAFDRKPQILIRALHACSSSIRSSYSEDSMYRSVLKALSKIEYSLELL